METKQQIIEVGIALAETKHVCNVTANLVANLLGISRPLVCAYYKDNAGLRREIMREAIVRKNLDVIAQGLSDPNGLPAKVDRETKRKALKWLSNKHGIRKIN